MILLRSAAISLRRAHLAARQGHLVVIWSISLRGCAILLCLAYFAVVPHFSEILALGYLSGFIFFEISYKKTYNLTNLFLEFIWVYFFIL